MVAFHFFEDLGECLRRRDRSDAGFDTFDDLGPMESEEVYGTFVVEKTTACFIRG